jgi:hypothetical protein
MGTGVLSSGESDRDMKLTTEQGLCFKPVGREKKKYE